MWRAVLFLLTQIVIMWALRCEMFVYCVLIRIDHFPKPFTHVDVKNITPSTTEEEQTVTPFYALSTGIAPAPVLLRLGNSTIDSSKAFKVPQPSQAPTQGTLSVPHSPKLDMVPHVVSVKNTYFDHDRKYGPTFEDTPEGNITKITVQLGEDAHLNCRISLLLDKTVSDSYWYLLLSASICPSVCLYMYVQWKKNKQFVGR
ncbi:hypothetical protein ACJJTC_017912 [Scirpophaga incertulas]